MPRTSQLREKILSAAVAILASQGLEGLHARSIASALEINHASVHYYYKSRAELLVAVAKFATDNWLAELDSVKQAKDGESLRKHIETFTNSFGQTGARVLIALLAACPGNPGVAEHLGAFVFAQSELLSKTIERTRNADVRVRKGPLRQGTYLLTALVGAEILRTTEPTQGELHDWPAGFSAALMD